MMMGRGRGGGAWGFFAADPRHVTKETQMDASGKFGKGNIKAGKLTLSQVGEIRRAYAEGVTQGALCRYYGVSIGTIGRIVRGETWTGQARVGKGTQADIDASQARLAAMLGLPSVEMLGRVPIPQEPGLEENPFAPPSPTRAIPPSPLDGGDAPSEGDGSGLSAVQERARAYGLDVDKMLKGDA